MTVPVRVPRIVAAGLLWGSLTAVLAVPVVTALEPSAEPSAEPSVSASPSPSALPPAEPVGVWRVMAFDPWGEGLVDPAEDSPLTVVFLADSRLEGDTACGRYIGGYSLEGESLSTGVHSQGYEACDQRQREEAIGLSTALDTVASWTATPTRLELLDEAGTVRLVLAQGSLEGPAGTWTVVRFLRPNGRPAEVGGEHPPSLTLGPDDEVSGASGCRFFEGAWTSDADSIDIGPLEPVGLPCEGDAGRDERQLLRAIGEAIRWEREGERLVLVDAFGLPAVELRADSTGSANEDLG